MKPRTSPTERRPRRLALRRLGLAVLALMAWVGCSRAPDRAAGSSDPASSGAPAPTAQRIVLATTTSTQDSGLLDVLLPAFRRGHPIDVKVVAVGTGEALAMGGRGDADVLLVHAPAKELEFMKRGDGKLRLAVMHNDFVLLGPPGDPATAKGLEVREAFGRIADRGMLFVSRGDGSGTHTKELALWSAASRAVDQAPWRLDSGQGMGETLRIATEKRAYVLADRGTYLAQRKTLELVIVSEGSSLLFNPYAVIVVNPEKFPKVRAQAGEQFARWLVQPAAQRLIEHFGVDTFGQPLFVPDATGAGPDGGDGGKGGKP